MAPLGFGMIATKALEHVSWSPLYSLAGSWKISGKRSGKKGFMETGQMKRVRDPLVWFFSLVTAANHSNPFVFTAPNKKKG